MLALTLWPEWTWATVHLDKDVENRTWEPPLDLLGKTVALHAGKHIGGRAAKVALREGLEAACGSAQIAGWTLDEVVTEPGGRVRVAARRPGQKQAVVSHIICGAITGVATLDRVVHEGDDDPVCRTAWWVGPVGLVWRDKRPLAEPVVCSGFQRLWHVPLHVRQVIEAQLPDLQRPRTEPEVINRHWYHGRTPPTPNLYIGRGSPLGNPFAVQDHGDAALAKYRVWLWQKMKARDRTVMRELERITPETHLVCSCKPRPCHGDVVVAAWKWLKSLSQPARPTP